MRGALFVNNNPPRTISWFWYLQLTEMYFCAGRARRSTASNGCDQLGECLLLVDQTTSRTLSLITSLMMSQRYFSPRTSASPNFIAWSMVILPGRGGSLGSTTAWTTAG